jgi:hypothetical protein
LVHIDFISYHGPLPMCSLPKRGIALSTVFATLKAQSFPILY